MLTADLRAHREQLLVEHVEAENNNDVDKVIATFGHPRYELVPTEEIFDGDVEVRRYYREKEVRGHRRYEIVRLYHSDDAVIVEIRTLSMEPEPPYRVDLPSIAVFEFEGPRLMCERVYYDLASFMRVAGDLPARVVTTARKARRTARLSGRKPARWPARCRCRRRRRRARRRRTRRPRTSPGRAGWPC